MLKGVGERLQMVVVAACNNSPHQEIAQYESTDEADLKVESKCFVSASLQCLELKRLYSCCFDYIYNPLYIYIYTHTIFFVRVLDNAANLALMSGSLPRQASTG